MSPGGRRRRRDGRAGRAGRAGGRGRAGLDRAHAAAARGARVRAPLHLVVAAALFEALTNSNIAYVFASLLTVFASFRNEILGREMIDLIKKFQKLKI